VSFCFDTRSCFSLFFVATSFDFYVTIGTARVGAHRDKWKGIEFTKPFFLLVRIAGENHKSKMDKKKAFFSWRWVGSLVSFPFLFLLSRMHSVEQANEMIETIQWGG